MIETNWGWVHVYAAFLPRCWGLAVEVLVQHFNDRPPYELGQWIDHYSWVAVRVRVGPFNGEMGVRVPWAGDGVLFTP